VATSRSFVARLESTAGDARVSTVERYAGSLEYVVRYHLVPLDQSADEPTVVVHESSSVSNGV
jgi:predicted transcriptional regulator